MLDSTVILPLTRNFADVGEFFFNVFFFVFFVVLGRIFVKIFFRIQTKNTLMENPVKSDVMP